MSEWTKKKHREDEWYRVKRAVYRARQRCDKSGIEFKLTAEDMGYPPALCPVLGVPMSFFFDGRDYTPSLDRIDNTKGYTADNVQWISFRANRIKSNVSVGELWRIYKHVEQCNVQKTI